jgi:hypothetical protein
MTLATALGYIWDQHKDLGQIKVWWVHLMIFMASGSWAITVIIVILICGKVVATN